ncbi:C-type lectin domain family 4 member G-like [Rhinoderma darwinii]|uniref:C-type lectin domain family 4 member G-like n=1 Tax=Rhinoderma darwinii TaxID=43563 RepID=UPI003F660DD2
MHHFYRSSEKRVKTVCGITDDDDVDDYENVVDNMKVPDVPERVKKGNKTTGKRDELQLKYMNKPANSADRAGNTNHGPRTVPTFQPPPIGLDFSSPAVNVAFSDQTGSRAVESRVEVKQISEKKCKWDWKKMVLIFVLVLMFLFWILLTSIMFIYYSNISNQLTDLKKNASQIQDLTKKERDTWKEDLMKVNQTLVNGIAVLKSDIQSIKRNLGLCTSCPAKWTLRASSCYFLSTSHQTWENSKKECSKMDSSLLILKSQKELDALRPLIGNKRFWIGLKRSDRNIWVWVDGTIPVYTNWNSGEPNNIGHREHCTEMITGGWNDLDCSKTIDYICRKPTAC